MFNINDELEDYAQSKGLIPIATGGNCDFMSVPLQANKGIHIILADHKDSGSPDNLEAPALLVLYINEAWDSSIDIRFTTAREAIDAFTNPKTVKNTVWLGQLLLEEDMRTAYLAENCARFTTTAKENETFFQSIGATTDLYSDGKLFGITR